MWDDRDVQLMVYAPPSTHLSSIEGKNDCILLPGRWRNVIENFAGLLTLPAAIQAGIIFEMIQFGRRTE